MLAVYSRPGYCGAGEGGKTSSRGQKLGATALLTRTGPLQKTAPGGRRSALRHTWNCSAVQEESRHVTGATRWQRHTAAQTGCGLTTPSISQQLGCELRTVTASPALQKPSPQQGAGTWHTTFTWQGTGRHFPVSPYEILKTRNFSLSPTWNCMEGQNPKMTTLAISGL